MILTATQGPHLAGILHAIRPDWPRASLETLLWETNQAGGLPGNDYVHAVRAAAHYATQTGADGKPAKRTPAFYVQPGKHWDDTAPPESTHPRAPRTPCEDHPTEMDGPNCRSCWGDYRVGDRPQHRIGKHWDPHTHAQHPQEATKPGPGAPNTAEPDTTTTPTI